jgi:hypothetical protein
MKNYKEAWPKWLLDAVTPEVEKELGDLQWGDVRWGDLRLGDVRLGDVRWGDVRLGDVRLGDVRLGDLWWGDVRLGDVRLGDAIWQDYFDVLWRAPHEVAGLISALKNGKVDGSTYESECACLVGTIANLQHCNYNDIPGLVPDRSRPIERFFLAIGTESTPENNPWSRVAVRWAEIFQELSVKHGV